MILQLIRLIKNYIYRKLTDASKGDEKEIDLTEIDIISDLDQEENEENFKTYFSDSDENDSLLNMSFTSSDIKIIKEERFSPNNLLSPTSNSSDDCLSKYISKS